MRHIGFTGTRRGMTSRQQQMLWTLLRRWGGKEPTAYHHGDCVGADAQLHTLVRYFARGSGSALSLIVHPPVEERHRAWCVGDEQRVEQPYLTRNHAIVEETHWLIAAPGEQEEQQRSGTWATVRFARKMGKDVLFCMPDGRLLIEQHAQGSSEVRTFRDQLRQ